MKFLVISLLSVSLLFATVYDGSSEDFDIDIETGSITGSSELLDNPDGTDYMECPGAVIETLSDEDPFGLTYSTPIERALSRRDEGSFAWPLVDWFDDIEVYGGAVGGGQDFDIDEDTGDIYAICDTDHATQDSIIVFRSQDGGATWAFWRATYSASGEMNNPKIRVAKDGSGQPWVYMMYVSNSGLRTRRMTPDQSSSFYETITADVADFADMDADVGSGAYVYATWVPNGTVNVWAARNAIDGSGWVSGQSLFTNTEVTSTPAIAAGAGGTVAVAFIDDRMSTVPQIRIKRSTNYASTWLGSANVSNSGASMLENCDIAFSHGSTQIGWIALTFCFADDNFGYYHSGDSGANWTYGAVFAGTGTDENLGNIRARKSTGDLTVAYNSDPGDDVMFSWATASSPTSFTTPVVINEFVATGYWPSAAGWNGSGYSAVLYTNWDTNYRLMFDWWGNTGIEGTSAGTGMDMIRNAPNPFNATTNINFSLAQSSPVTISIYNIAGQLVSTLADNQSFDAGSHSVQWNGQSFSPGVYFCRLSADGVSQTHRMLMVR